MALEKVDIKNALGATVGITTDVSPDGSHTQVQKMAFGADGAAPTLVDPTNRLPVALPSAARVPGLILVSALGTVAAGARRVSFQNVGANNGTVLGTTFRPGRIVTFEAGNNDTLAEIAYNAAGTEFLIAEVR